MLILRYSLILLSLMVPLSGAAQVQASARDAWVDYVSGEYDIIPNVIYATANGTQLKLDLYEPRDRSTPLPTLVLFHGGGWVAGLKERNVLQLLPYISLGWAVINVEYRTASSSLAPAAVEDCRCALRWVATHAKEFGFDTSKIVLTGGSAGGHLALITGMLPPFSPLTTNARQARPPDGGRRRNRLFTPQQL